MIKKGHSEKDRRTVNEPRDFPSVLASRCPKGLPVCTRVLPKTPAQRPRPPGHTKASPEVPITPNYLSSASHRWGNVQILTSLGKKGQIFFSFFPFFSIMLFPCHVFLRCYKLALKKKGLRVEGGDLGQIFPRITIFLRMMKHFLPFIPFFLRFHS